MRFAQNVQSQGLCKVKKRFESVIVKDCRYEQNCVRSQRTCLIYLVLIKDEILAQNGDLDIFNYFPQIFGGALEVMLLGKAGYCRSACLFICSCDLNGVKIRLDKSL